MRKERNQSAEHSSDEASQHCFLHRFPRLSCHRKSRFLQHGKHGRISDLPHSGFLTVLQERCVHLLTQHHLALQPIALKRESWRSGHRAVLLHERLQAVLRRAQGLAITDEERPFTSGKLSVDFNRNEVLLGGHPIKLTSTERKLLYYLIRNEGRILSHESLLTKVWGDNYVDARDLLRVHIQHLRQKLEDNTETPNIIVTEHGIGYKFVRPTGT